MPAGGAVLYLWAAGTACVQQLSARLPFMLLAALPLALTTPTHRLPPYALSHPSSLPSLLCPLCCPQVGPRMELEIVKVEEGLCEGQVLFHKYQQRSAAEAAAQQGEWEEKAALREERRKQQVRAL